MDSTWERRELPVLDEIVRLLDDDSGAMPPVMVIADAVGMPVADVSRACAALDDGGFIEYQDFGGGASIVLGIHASARRAVGQWPSPEAWVDRLVRGLLEAADRELDPDKKSKLRATAEFLGGVGRDIVVGVASGGITGAMGS